MKGWIGLALLLLGLLVAASFGGRNGAAHTQHRTEAGRLDAALAALKVIEEGKVVNAEVDAELAKIGKSLNTLTMEEHIALMESNEKVAAQVEAFDKMRENLDAWNASSNPVEFHHLAEMEVSKNPLPTPRERLFGWLEAAGVPWFIGIVLIVCGAVLARLDQAERNAGSKSTSAGRVDFSKSMATTLERLEAIQGLCADMPMDDPAEKPREAIDALGREIFEPLVEGRGQLIAKHGLAGFAEYFGPYSAGERNVNRAWSALTDGHAVVAREALVNAVAAFKSAAESYEAVDTRG